VPAVTEAWAFGEAPYPNGAGAGDPDAAEAGRLDPHRSGGRKAPRPSGNAVPFARTAWNVALVDRQVWSDPFRSSHRRSMTQEAHGSSIELAITAAARLELTPSFRSVREIDHEGKPR
jgi:hypothetical protein